MVFNMAYISINEYCKRKYGEVKTNKRSSIYQKIIRGTYKEGVDYKIEKVDRILVREDL